MNKFILLAFVVFTLLPACLFAQISLDECYSLARQNYPKVKKSDIIDKIKDYNITNANMGYLPKILFSARVSYQSDVTKIPSEIFDIFNYEFSSLSKDQYKLNVDIIQPLWDGGKTEAEKKNIKAQHKSDESTLEVELYNLRYRVSQLFFSILLLNEQLTQNEIYGKDLDRSYNIIKESIKNGVANTSDLDVITLAQIKNKKAEINIKALKESYEHALSLLIGKSVYDGLIKPEYMEIDEYNINRSDIKRPELTYFADKIDLLEISKKNINASYMPTFDLFFSAGYGKPGFDWLDNSFQPYYIVGVKMDWNIVSFYTGQRNKKIIDLNKNAVTLEKDTFLLNLDIDIANQKAKINQIKDSIKYDDEIVKLRQNIKNVAESKMKQGLMTTNDYLQEVTAENIAKQEKILHEIELLQAVYEMKNIVGER